MAVRRFLLAATLPALVLIGWRLLHPFPASAQEWQRFTSEEGRFSVDLPAPPSISQRTRDTIVGTIVENSFVVKIDDNTGYQVEYQDLPGIAVFFAGRGGIINRALRAFLENVKGVEESDETITVDGHPGKRMAYTVGGKGSGVIVMFMVGNRLYVLNASGKDADRFFQSVRVISSIATGR